MRRHRRAPDYPVRPQRAANPAHGVRATLSATVPEKMKAAVVGMIGAEFTNASHVVEAALTQFLAARGVKWK